MSTGQGDRGAIRGALLWMVLVLAVVPSNAVAGSSQELQPVRVQLKWAHQFQFAGYYAAIHQGYYREAGLDVSLHEYRTGISTVDQLLGGRVDFAVADTGVLIYRSTGVPVVALATVYQHSPSILISLEDSGIHELEDLRGRRAMLGGGYMNAELMAMLNRAGITGEDIRILPSDPDPRALIDGRTDAYNAYATNESYRLQQLGIPYRVFEPRSFGVDFYGDTLVTTEAVIERDPEMVRDFRDATLRGWEYAVEHPGEVIDLIQEHYNTQNKSRDHHEFEAREIIRLILADVVPVGYMNEQRWRRIEQVFREQGLMAQEVDMQQFLYQPERQITAGEILWRYRTQIGIGLVALVGLLMFAHIISLRVQIRRHTGELEQARVRAESDARTDALTGLPNRRYFYEELARDFAQAQRHDIPLAVITLDLDHFKDVNDRYGHAAGDDALRNAARLLSRYMRQGDLVARLGGEEFAVACLNASEEEARALAERLCREMQDSETAHEGEQFRVTASLGYAMREQGDSMEQLMNKADQALYAAKKAGRNCIMGWRS